MHTNSLLHNKYTDFDFKLKISIESNLFALTLYELFLIMTAKSF